MEHKVKPKSRREILKLLTVAGFGLVVPSCGSETSNQESPVTKGKVKEEIDSIVVVPEIEQLEEEIKVENVIYLSRDDTDYENKRTGFNLNHDKYPLIIALCKNTDGVAEAVRYAIDHGLKITVKSGGHSFEGFSSNDSGLMINLSLMNRLEWMEGDYLKAGPAVLLRELYDFILPSGRLVPAGSCGTVGLAGLTLGGGYGFFSRQYGLTCDHLVTATFVDGKGKIHEVDEYHELMWALRGGGNGNFGVVTSMVFKSRPLPEGFKRFRFQAYDLDSSRAKLLMQNWFQYANNLPHSVFSAFVLNGKTLTVLITNFENDTPEVDAMVANLSDLMDKTSIGSKKPLKGALSTYYGTQHSIYFKNSSAGYYQDYSTIEGCIDDILEVVLNNRIIYQINTLGGMINSAEFETNSCYPHRKMKYLCELQSYWKKEKDKSARLTAFNAVQGILERHGINAHYRNYPNIDFKNWEEAYYGKENYIELQGIKRKYDPDDTFKHEQSVTFVPHNVEE